MYRTNVLVIQSIYVFFFHGLSSLDFILENKNINKFFFYELNCLYNNIVNKNILLDFIFCNIIKLRFNITLIDLIIFKIVLFNLFLNKKKNLKIIFSQSLLISKRFCISNSYLKNKKIIKIIISSYFLLKLMS